LTGFNGLWTGVALRSALLINFCFCFFPFKSFPLSPYSSTVPLPGTTTRKGVHSFYPAGLPSLLFGPPPIHFASMPELQFLASRLSVPFCRSHHRSFPFAPPFTEQCSDEFSRFVPVGGLSPACLPFDLIRLEF